LTVLGFLALAAVAPAGAGAQTVVSLMFDDGIATQFDNARPQLLAHGMLGTFYINSGNVGKYGYYMNWSQVDALNADRNEIGGHTIDHVRLAGPGDPPSVSPTEARRQICVDASTLRGRGYQVLDFAYPYGAGYDSSAVRTALHDCGFVSARNYGGLRDTVCTTCSYSETIPPGDPFALKSTGFQDHQLTLNELQGWVTQAEMNGGGWVPIIFHDICDPGVCLSTTSPPSVRPTVFEQFLDWLKGRGTVVKTVRSVMGYPDFPPPPPPVASPGKVVADKVTAFASLKVRASQDVDKLFVTASMAEAGTLSAAGSVNVPRASKVHRFKRVSANATPGTVVKLRLRLSKKRLRAVKRALRHHRKLKAKLTITARDRAGNTKTEKRTVRLRP
jgi:peptidoglycan/xylan/chitin deacetylase (PgdA/CDA1 family)